MDHDRARDRVVLPGRVGEVESLRQREVDLDRRELPVAPDRIGEMEVDLRAVERSFALRNIVRIPPSIERAPQGVGGVGPHLLVADRLPRLGRQLDPRISEAQGTMDVDGQFHHADDLVDELVSAAEDMRVVLRHAPHSKQPMQHAGFLVAVDGSELEGADREIPVAPRARFVDQDVERAVHRLHVVLGALELHRRVHVVLVLTQMAGRFPQDAARDVRCEYRHVAA